MWSSRDSSLSGSQPSGSQPSGSQPSGSKLSGSELIGSEVPVEPDPDDWREAYVAERSEEARINEADDDSAQAIERDAAFGSTDADEADVIAQHQPVDGDDEEDAPRMSPSVSQYE